MCKSGTWQIKVRNQCDGNEVLEKYRKQEQEGLNKTGVIRIKLTNRVLSAKRS